MFWCLSDTYWFVDSREYCFFFMLMQVLPTWNFLHSGSWSLEWVNWVGWLAISWSTTFSLASRRDKYAPSIYITWGFLIDDFLVKILIATVKLVGCFARDIYINERKLIWYLGQVDTSRIITVFISIFLLQSCSIVGFFLRDLSTLFGKYSLTFLLLFYFHSIPPILITDI